MAKTAAKPTRATKTHAAGCRECSGTGKIECPEMCGEDPECEICKGTGEADCTDCDGSGRVGK